MTITVQLGALQVKKLPSLGSFCMTLTAACFASEKIIVTRKVLCDTDSCLLCKWKNYLHLEVYDTDGCMLCKLKNYLHLEVSV